MPMHPVLDHFYGQPVSNYILYTSRISYVFRSKLTLLRIDSLSKWFNKWHNAYVSCLEQPACGKQFLSKVYIGNG